MSKNISKNSSEVDNKLHLTADQPSQAKYCSETKLSSLVSLEDRAHAIKGQEGKTENQIILEKRLRNRINSRKKRLRDHDNLCAHSAKKRDLAKENNRLSTENKKLQKTIGAVKKLLPSLQYVEGCSKIQASPQSFMPTPSAPAIVPTIETLHNILLPSLQHVAGCFDSQASSKYFISAQNAEANPQNAKACTTIVSGHSERLDNKVFKFVVPTPNMPVQQTMSQNPSFLPSYNQVELPRLVNARCGGCLSCSTVRCLAISTPCLISIAGRSDLLSPPAKSDAGQEVMANMFPIHVSRSLAAHLHQIHGSIPWYSDLD